ncbi:class I SAM-dependent methyltransferase [Caulobacter segnis]
MSNTSASFGFTDVDASLKARPGARQCSTRVARNYDIMNDLMSGGVHRLWKDAVAGASIRSRARVIIDCAGGTGRHGPPLRQGLLVPLRRDAAARTRPSTSSTTTPR